MSLLPIITFQLAIGRRWVTKRSLNENPAHAGRKTPGGGERGSSRNIPGSSARVKNNGGGQVNHVNAAENQDNAPNNVTNNAPHNVLEAGSSAQPVVLSPVAAAASSGGGMCEQPVNF